MHGTEVIPVEAVVAATKVLYADKMSNHSGDNAPQILDACEAVVKKILEAATPLIRAQAFDDAAAKLRSDMEVPQRIWVSRKVTALAMIERGDA